MITVDTKATELASEYASVIRLAAAKEWRKWSHLSSLERPFDRAELDQWALEAILIMGGLMRTGPNSQTQERGRKLQTLTECAGHDGWIQRNVDLYVSDKAAKAVRARNVRIRIGAATTTSIDTPPGADEQPIADTLGTTRPGEANPSAMTGVAGRYPILWSVRVMGTPKPAVMRRLGLSEPAYRKAWHAEMDDLTAWAVRNRRIKAA